MSHKKGFWPDFVILDSNGGWHLVHFVPDALSEVSGSLYTQEEWDKCLPPSWELDADGQLLYEGKPAEEATCWEIRYRVHRRYP